MKRSLTILIIATLLIGFIQLAVYSQPPPLPMTVFGYVHIQRASVNVTAPAGLYVYSKTDSTKVSNATTESTGYYAISIDGLTDGAPFDLWVQDVNITRKTFYAQTWLELNLTVIESVSPTITVVSPTPGATVTTPLWINATLSDNLLINSSTITLKLNATTKTHTYDSATGLLSYQTGTLTSGFYTINVTVKDIAENQGTETWNFTISAELYLVVRGNDNGIYYRNYTGSWSGWTALPGATTDSPAAAVQGTNLHIVVKGLTGEIWHGYVDLTTSTWSSWSLLSGATPSTPELTA